MMRRLSREFGKELLQKVQTHGCEAQHVRPKKQGCSQAAVT
jgi:hypothetical protein